MLDSSIYTRYHPGLGYPIEIDLFWIIKGLISFVFHYEHICYNGIDKLVFIMILINENIIGIYK